VEEALYLSSRIVVITARPARIRQIVTVPFPEPRRSDIIRTPRFLELRAEIEALVMREYVDQERQREAGTL
jgi:NitT/TauT family transport system ATP-binding protein